MTSSYYPIHEKADFDPNNYAEQIEKAVKSGDKKKVAHLIVGINNIQRQKVREPYRIRFNRTVEDALKKMFSGDAETLMLALMKGPLEYDTEQLAAAMKGLGTNDGVLIEILCSRTPEQLKAINAFYNHTHGKTTLADTVIDDTSGEYKDFLVDLVNGSKNGGTDTDDAAAYQDAVRLFADGKGKFKGGTSHVRTVLATRNQYQLRKVFAEFKKLSGTDFDKFIDFEYSGDLKKTYKTIVHVTENKQKYFADQIYDSMVGFGTRDNNLIRLIVSRSEIDLNLIKDEYKLKYKKTVEHDIEKDTSGIYRETLLAICAGNQA